MADARDQHGDHDPLVIAGLLDRELADPQRAIGVSRLASCPDCAGLHADLLALSTATRDLPLPARPRDFMLTPADAVRLTASLPGEPGATPARLAGVMTDPRAAASHASHDTMLVASLADRSMAPSERAAAEALIATCGPCAELHADLVALRAATQAMPTPQRPRDFMLTAADAVRMRPGGWRRFVAVFGSSRDMLSRPLAVGLTTLGLAGLLFAAIPSVLPGSAASSAPFPVDQAVGGVLRSAASAGAQDSSTSAAGAGTAAGAPPAATSVGDVAGGALGPLAAASAAQPTAPAKGMFGTNQYAASPRPGVEAGTGSTDVQATPGRPATIADATTDAVLAQPAGPSMLVVLSGSFLIVGLGLFLVRWSARRFGDD